MGEAEAIYEGIKNATDESAQKLGGLSVLHSTGAIDSFAMIAKNYSEVLRALEAYEQVQFLGQAVGSKFDPSARDFAMFKLGQGSITKYPPAAYKYILSVDEANKS